MSALDNVPMPPGVAAATIELLVEQDPDAAADLARALWIYAEVHGVRDGDPAGAWLSAWAAAITEVVHQRSTEETR